MIQPTITRLGVLLDAGRAVVMRRKPDGRYEAMAVPCVYTEELDTVRDDAVTHNAIATGGTPDLAIERLMRRELCPEQQPKFRP